MIAKTLDGHLGTSVTIDLCTACQVFWFDARESLQLSPGAVIDLFQLVGEGAVERRGAGAVRTTPPRCPQCNVVLLLTHDRQRNTPFQYYRCPRDHGRLTSFVDFLREKDFITPLSAKQVEDLRRNVRTINCSNCGAPIDLNQTTSCTHCGSPLSMLDLERTCAIVSQLRAAAAPPAATDLAALPMELERARREVDAAFAAFDQRPGWFTEVSSAGLIGAGLSSLARWLKDNARD